MTGHPIEVNAWLALAVGEDRQHAGNGGYEDEPSQFYSWDSAVPHHAEVAVGDRIVIWDKHDLIGVSVIKRIDSAPGTKAVFECACCGRASIKERRRKSPRFRCSACLATFAEARARTKKVTTYRSDHAADWQDLTGVLAGTQLRAMAIKPKSQLSIRPLRWRLFLSALSAEGRSL